ncbi:MAG: hypothetical protein JWM00_406 [Candidatus Saccharibacteria bacterium]|nr:hypothetical protein [Candidatus Saccharibacteria bacterium]
MKKGDHVSYKGMNRHAPAGFVMFTAFVGAFIHFCQGANDFGDFVYAFLEALVWPGFLVYHVLQMLGA